MKVRIVKHLISIFGSMEPGQIREIPDAKAKSWIKSEIAKKYPVTKAEQKEEEKRLEKVERLSLEKAERLAAQKKSAELVEEEEKKEESEEEEEESED